MTVSIFSKPVNVRQIQFSANKYGRELLIDVAWINDMPAFARTVEPYSLDFYDITLVTGGQGSFWLDEQEYQLKPNQVLFTTPGQIRRWYVSNLKGICLFFPAKFILDHYHDPLLLHRMCYFHTHAGPRNLVLEQQQASQLVTRLSLMQQEVTNIQDDSSDLLRSMCHEVLVYLNRWYTQAHGLVSEKASNKTISRFRQCLEEYFPEYHKVVEYSALLSVSPGHLNFLCKTHLGRGASQLIQDRIMCEACRRLTHSSISVEDLSYALGYNNPSYFCRSFKRQNGVSPLQYRLLGHSY
jgi:AraC family transcriptional activator of pobA